MDERKAAKIAKYVRIPVLVLTAVSSITVGFTGSATFFAYFTKLFNIIDILSNLAKINVKLGPRFKIVMSFTENLKIPRIAFLANLSPLKDSNFDDRDVDAYKLLPRGTRGKITEGNENVFIFAAKNFVMSLSIITLLCLWRLFGLCLTDQSKNWYN